MCWRCMRGLRAFMPATWHAGEPTGTLYAGYRIPSSGHTAHFYCIRRILRCWIGQQSCSRAGMIFLALQKKFAARVILSARSAEHAGRLDPMEGHILRLLRIAFCGRWFGRWWVRSFVWRRAGSGGKSFSLLCGRAIVDGVCNSLHHRDFFSGR